MRRQIKLTTRRELTAAISQRYQAADRNGKKLILDEFVKLTSYHRKHAIRLLTTEGCTHQGRQVGRRTYPLFPSWVPTKSTTVPTVENARFWDVE